MVAEHHLQENGRIPFPIFKYFLFKLMVPIGKKVKIIKTDLGSMAELTVKGFSIVGILTKPKIGSWNRGSIRFKEPFRLTALGP